MNILIKVPQRFVDMGVDRNYTKEQIQDAYTFYVTDTLGQMSNEDHYDMEQVYKDVLDWFDEDDDYYK